MSNFLKEKTQKKFKGSVLENFQHDFFFIFMKKYLKSIDQFNNRKIVKRKEKTNF